MTERQVWEYMTVFVKAEAAAELAFLEEHWTWKMVSRATPPNR